MADGGLLDYRYEKVHMMKRYTLRSSRSTLSWDLYCLPITIQNQNNCAWTFLLLWRHHSAASVCCPPLPLLTAKQYSNLNANKQTSRPCPPWPPLAPLHAGNKSEPRVLHPPLSVFSHFSCWLQKQQSYEVIYRLLHPEIRADSAPGLFDGHSRHVMAAFVKHWSVFFGFSKFWMQEFSALHPSIAPLLSPVPLRADSWAMAFPLRSDNWKAWWLAAVIATICESEWFGECCIRGRGGRGLCESQTASRGELLTPHRCQKAPRWPFAEPRLLMRKRVIIPLWGKYKHVLLWIPTTAIRWQNPTEVQLKHQYLNINIPPVAAKTTIS